MNPKLFKEKDTGLSPRMEPTTGKYSFTPRDEFVMCVLDGGSPVNHSDHYFGLSYAEWGDRTKSVELFVDRQGQDTIYFSITLPLDFKLTNVIKPLQDKSQSIGLLLEDKSNKVRYYICQGPSSKVEQLFPILRDQLLLNRFCLHGVESESVGLYDLFIQAYEKIKQNFIANATSTKFTFS